MIAAVETQYFPGPGALSAAFGGPVYLPAGWPEPFFISSPRFMLDRGPAGIGYRIDVGTDDGVPVMIAGRVDPPSQRVGMRGASDSYWFTIPELDTHSGLGLRSPNGHFHVVLSMPMQVHLVGYRTLEQSIVAATNLVLIDSRP